jgi:hypothetical protein
MKNMKKLNIHAYFAVQQSIHFSVGSGENLGRIFWRLMPIS